MLTQLDWDTLESRRTRAHLQLIYKETHDLIPSNITHHRISTNQPRPETSSGKCISTSLQVRTVTKSHCTLKPFLPGTYYPSRSAVHQLWINSRISYLKLSWLIYIHVTKISVYRLLASRVLYGIATTGICTVTDRCRCRCTW